MVLGGSVLDRSNSRRCGHCIFRDMGGRYCVVDFSATEQGGQRAGVAKIAGDTHTGGDRATAFWDFYGILDFFVVF